MARNANTVFRKRSFTALAILIIFGFGSSLIGLINVGLVHGSQYKQKAEAEQMSDNKISAQRGTITDRNGNVMAISADAYKVYIDPKAINDKESKINARTLANQLASLLKMDPEEVYEMTQKKHSRYKVVKTKVPHSTKVRIEKLIDDNRKNGYREAIGFEEDVVRYYPYSNLASTVIGLSNSGRGSSGLEYYYNDILSGVPGRSISTKNPRQEDTYSGMSSYHAVKEGENLQLTLDNVIQYYLDSALSSGVKRFNASYGYGIVMDVKTGAILAMSSQPDFNCNEPYKIQDEEKESEIKSIANKKQRQKAESDQLFAQWRNRTVADSYEPGSVFKCITAAAGIEEGVVTPSEMFTCTGSIAVAGQIYHCSNRAGHGAEDFTHSLMNSCNPIYIQVAQRIGAKTFSKYFDAFGMSEMTGVDLPAEAKPRAGVTYYTADSMGPVQLASSSFGQTFQVSPIQVCTAINAIANDGKLMQPYIVGKWMNRAGDSVHVTKPVMKRQVVSKQTARTVGEMMEQVVIGGTAKNAYVPGYRIAGKTGTSEKLSIKNKKLYIGSFCGFAPVDDPQITCLIVIDEPHGATTGGKTAAPIAAEVIQNTLRYLNVEPEYNDKESQNLDVRTPNVVDVDRKAAEASLKTKGFQCKIIGSGKKVIRQNPAPGKLIPKNGIVVLYTSPNAKTQRVKVPNLTGLSFAQAKAVANAAGLNVESTGQSSSVGASYSQSIPAGSSVAVGSVVTVSYVSSDPEMEIEDTGNAD